MTSNRNHGEAEHVERLLERQQELFGELDIMSQRQALLVQEEDTDQLLEVLSTRQQVIDRISEISAHLEPYRASWDAVMGGLDEIGKVRVRRRLDALAILAERIAKRDEADRQVLETRRQTVAGELMQVNRGRGAMAAYRAGDAETGPRMQDREA
jgi:C4-dicarboxylate-specific signal transduction histidine kinase